MIELKSQHSQHVESVENALKVLDTIPTIGEQVDALEMAIEALQERKVGKWTLCSERLPDNDYAVLVTYFFHGVIDYKYGNNKHLRPCYYVDVASCYNGEWISNSDEYKVAKDKHEVIAWMPLPEPYKEG